MKILIVDDCVDTCEFLSMSLNAQGWEAGFVHSTSDAIIKVHEQEPDYIILDLTVPGLPIEQFVKAARNHIPNCKIVIVSGSDTLIDRAAEINAHACVRKPFEPRTLISIFKA